MISVLNQFRSPWIIKSFPDQETQVFSKMKRFVDERDEEKMIFIRTNFSPDILSDMPDVNEILSGMVKMKDIQVLTDTKLAIGFSPKTFDSTIYVNTKEEGMGKKILLLSMYMKGCTIVNITKQNTFLLEVLQKEEFFGAVVSFNTEDASFVVETVSGDNKLASIHFFDIVDGEIRYDKRTVPAPEKVSQCRLVKFRPAHISQAVLVTKEGDRTINDLKEYSSDKARFDKIIVDFGDYTKILNDLRESGYRAATLFVPGNLSKEDSIRYVKFSKEAKRFFRVFYLVNHLGKITKLQIN